LPRSQQPSLPLCLLLTQVCHLWSQHWPYPQPCCSARREVFNAFSSSDVSPAFDSPLAGASKAAVEAHCNRNMLPSKTRLIAVRLENIDISLFIVSCRLALQSCNNCWYSFFFLFFFFFLTLLTMYSSSVSSHYETVCRVVIVVRLKRLLCLIVRNLYGTYDVPRED
jgi:hypothetical protein